MTSTPPSNGSSIKFDRSFNLGHVLVTLSMVAALAGSYFGLQQQQALVAQRLNALEGQHVQFDVSRLVRLETRQEWILGEITELNHRMERLERRVGLPAQPSTP